MGDEWCRPGRVPAAWTVMLHEGPHPAEECSVVEQYSQVLHKVSIGLVDWPHCTVEVAHRSGLVDWHHTAVHEGGCQQTEGFDEVCRMDLERTVTLASKSRERQTERGLENDAEVACSLEKGGGGFDFDRCVHRDRHRHHRRHWPWLAPSPPLRCHYSQAAWPQSQTPSMLSPHRERNEVLSSRS